MDEFRAGVAARGWRNEYFFVGAVMEICEQVRVDSCAALPRRRCAPAPLALRSAVSHHYTRHRRPRAPAAPAPRAACPRRVSLLPSLSQKREVMTHIVPLLTFATIGVVFILCVVAFRSVMLPLRLLATIALTIGSVFGAANLVFRYVFRMDGLYWLVYPVGTPILIGIVIDYDVLLVSRIFEYRAAHGFATRAAVLRGLRRTGSTITLAGIIMMLAFGASPLLPSASLPFFAIQENVLGEDSFEQRAHDCHFLLHKDHVFGLHFFKTREWDFDRRLDPGSAVLGPHHFQQVLLEPRLR